MNIEEAALLVRLSARCWSESKEYLLALKRGAPLGSTIYQMAEKNLVDMNAAKPNFLYLMKHLEQHGWTAKAEDVPQKGDAP